MISLYDTLVGAWSLQRFVQEDMDGTISYPMGKNAKGSLYYTSGGHVSVHIMLMDRSVKIDQSLQQSGISYHDLGYLAYSGRFRIDVIKQLVIHDIAVSLYPDWIGSHQVRAVSLEGNQLELHFEQTMHGKTFRFRLLWVID
jgi:Lipocalin-like domain